MKKFLTGILAFLSLSLLCVKVNAATLTYDENTEKDGYHLEVYDETHCVHSTGNSNYVSIESSGLQTSIPILQGAFTNYNNIPGRLEFTNKYVTGKNNHLVSTIQALFYIDAPVGNPNAMISPASGYNGTGTPFVRIAEPYTCQMDGYAGYSYFRAYFSYCNKHKKYYYVGDQHVSYVCTAGEIGKNMTATFTYEHDLTRYLITPNNYTVHFNSNGGVGDMESQKFTYDTSGSLNSNIFVKDGYIFAGWNTKEDGTGIKYSDNQTVINLTTEKDSIIELYAQWKPIKYFITFIDNNAVSGTMYDKMMYFDEANNLPKLGYEKYYKIFYDAVGGTSEKDSEIDNFLFNGWLDTSDFVYNNEKYSPENFNLAYLGMINGVYDKYNMFLKWEKDKAKCQVGVYPDKAMVNNMTLQYGERVKLLADWNNPGVMLPDADKDGYALVGWRTFAGDIRKVNERYYPITNETLNAVWDKPDVELYFSGYNKIFECDGKTYCKEPVQIRAIGNDIYFPVSNVYITKPNSDDYISYNSDSYQKLYYADDCDNEDHIILQAKSSINTTKGKVYSEPKNLDFYIDHTAPELNVSCDSAKYVNVKATDSQSGLSVITLQKLVNGNWKDYTSITINDTSKYKEDFERIKVEQDSYGYKFRVKCSDHLDNTTISDEFYVIPLSFRVKFSKINGTTVGSDEVLHYLEGGNMMGYLVVDTFGFADSIEYEFDESLNVNKQFVYPNNDPEGKYTDEKEFLIPITILRNTDIPINITVKREDEVQKATVYLDLAPIDFSTIRSRIRRQPGQAN